MSIKHIVFAVLAVIALSILRVEAEIVFGIDLFYYWLGAVSAIIGIVGGGLFGKAKKTKPF